MSETLTSSPDNTDNSDIYDASGFIERMRGLFGDSETAQNRIDLLLKDGTQNTDELDKLIDDLAKDSLRQDENFMENAKTIRRGRLSPVEAERMIQQQKRILENRRYAIIEMAAIPEEALLNEIDLARQRVHDLVGEEDSPDEVLKKLGILTYNYKDDEVFTFPTDLMPDVTNDKWDVYLAAVLKHVKLRDETPGDRKQKKDELVDADKVRRFAHNRVAHDIHKILGFDKLDSDSWDFEKTRNLLAKMRDSRFPNIETAESKLTGEAVMNGLSAAKILGSYLSNTHHK